MFGVLFSKYIRNIINYNDLDACVRVIKEPTLKYEFRRYVHGKRIHATCQSHNT